MYIPLTFEGALSKCLYASGGIEGSFISGSTQYNWHLFTSSANLTVLKGTIDAVRIYIIGGGGGGACEDNSAGGGGAGEAKILTNQRLFGGVYTVGVGAGGEGYQRTNFPEYGNGSAGGTTTLSGPAMFYQAVGGQGGEFGNGNSGGDSGNAYSGGLNVNGWGGGGAGSTQNGYAGNAGIGLNGNGGSGSYLQVAGTYNICFAGGGGGDGTTSGIGVGGCDSAGGGNGGNAVEKIYGGGGGGGRPSDLKSGGNGGSGSIYIEYPVYDYCNNYFNETGSCDCRQVTFDITKQPAVELRGSGSYYYTPCGTTVLVSGSIYGGFPVTVCASSGTWFAVVANVTEGTGNGFIGGYATLPTGSWPECVSQSAACTTQQFFAPNTSSIDTFTFTAGASGGTAYYVPIGATTIYKQNLAAFQSLTTCAVTSSVYPLGITGAGSTLVTSSLDYCTQSLYSIIQNCNTLATASVRFSGSYYPTTGFTFLTNTVPLSGSCWNVIGSASLYGIPDYNNLTTQSAFASCLDCGIAITGSGRVSWSFTENSQDGIFTIYDNANVVTTLSGSANSSSVIVGGHYITASLTPVNYPVSGAIIMSIYINGAVTQSIGSPNNTTITSSFLVPSGSNSQITASITYYPNGIVGAKSYVFLAGPTGGNATYRLAGETTNRITALSSGSSMQVCAYTNSVSITGNDSKQFVGPDCGNIIIPSCNCYSASYTASINPPYGIQFIPCSSSVFSYAIIDYPATWSACISYPSSSLAQQGQGGAITSSLTISGSCTSGNCP